ncbi:MAG TPA: hypothetical protein VD926_00285 [Acidimicrobiales bacterium]|nr:hypothetical protein [Acidimicrobiales bacterium]
MQRPVRVAWFLRMDQQIEDVYGSATHAVDAHAEVIDEVLARGDAIGLHIHAWRWRDGWIDDYGDGDWVDECIDRSFAAFAQAFGRPCALTRLGSRWFDDRAGRRLVEQRVAVDLTVEPGQVDRPAGSVPHLDVGLPDHRRAPRRLHEVVPGLVELPLTAGAKVLGRNLRAHLSRMRRHGLRERLDQPLPLGMPAHGPHPFGEQVRRSLAIQQRPYLAFALRSDGLADATIGPRVRSHVAQVLALPEADRFRFVGPEEAVGMLQP